MGSRRLAPAGGRAALGGAGDPAADNILLENGRVGLIDWDESRVDASVLDLAALPSSGEDEGRLVKARCAALVWEVANGWVPEPAYVRRRLGELEVAPYSDEQDGEPGRGH